MAERMACTWREEQRQYRAESERRQAADQSYLDAGVVWVAAGRAAAGIGLAGAKCENWVSMTIRFRWLRRLG